jgi:hypothetical protein
MATKAARRAARAEARRVLNTRTGGFTGIELKFLDCAWDGVGLGTSTDGSNGELAPSSGCTGAISVPAQGDGESQRDGRKYTLKSCWVSGVIETSAFANQADCVDIPGYFIALVLDTQCNGVTIASEDVYINPGTTAPSMLPQPLRNLANTKRFKILDKQYIEHDGAYVVTDGTNTGSISPMISPKVNLSWKGNINCLSDGTTANVSSATDNALHLVAFAASSAFTPVFTGKSRVRFVG